MCANDHIVGVIEVINRIDGLPFNENDQDLLTAFSDQAAIAIDNSRLFNELQRSNLELILAYDATIEGWSRALELRDRDTEGHSVRVTDLTLRLAQSMGFHGDELVHIRRGALLHDIGKIGISDWILHKPGPLNDDELNLMRLHPSSAYEILSPIAFLRPALDIPYCHHEKWDGTGYPRGLKGEEIPLAARIFAVVDVYDNLVSDKPYRAGWNKDKALEYIREQSGKHFDPEVVEIFLTMMGNKT
jgi:HD-GYP domain-containing protein (c-di-GMP phosphodiesterase class II)